MSDIDAPLYDGSPPPPTDPPLEGLISDPGQPPPPPREPPSYRLTDLRDAARAIAESARGARLDERELVTLFFQQGFFSALGYGTVGEDIRLEQRVAQGRADVILRSFTGRPIALLEFKHPGSPLAEHLPQLQDYARGLLPAVAVLTNGGDFWLFLVDGEDLRCPPHEFDLADLSLDQARILSQRLQRRQVDWWNLADIGEVLVRCRAEPVRVTAPDQAGGRQFLQRFALFDSLFASDIFDWWQDAGQLADPAALCESVAEAVVAVFDFDFAGLSGDLLGTLYQSYFDPETRKALGEFYTPPEVVGFILDQVDYQGPQIRTRRLLDPACGSGTFLVYALRRYLEASAGHDPVATLRDLVGGLRIVGFDVNPFAVLMAQANYAAQILPLYAQAIRRNPTFTLTGLPVFRTDSLRKELQ